MILKDYCCGFLWKDGCRIYIFFDFIFSIMGLALFGLVVDVYRNPVDIFRALLDLKNNNDHANKIYSNSNPDLLINEINRLALMRIYEKCNIDGLNLDSEFIYKKLVISMIPFTLGTIGFFVTALLLIVAVFKEKKHCICKTIMCLEGIFLIPIIVGAFFFNASSLCPINYNIEDLPRQTIGVILTILTFLYKTHEIYTIYRYMTSCKEPVKNTHSEQAFQARRRSYSVHGHMPPRKSFMLTQSNKADVEEALLLKNLHPEEDPQVPYQAVKNSATRKSYIKMESFNFRNELNKIDEDNKQKSLNMEKDKSLIRIFGGRRSSPSMMSMTSTEPSSIPSTNVMIPPSVTSTDIPTSSTTTTTTTIVDDTPRRNHGSHRHRGRSSKKKKAPVEDAVTTVTTSEVVRGSNDKSKHHRKKNKSHAEETDTETPKRKSKNRSSKVDPSTSTVVRKTLVEEYIEKPNRKSKSRKKNQSSLKRKSSYKQKRHTAATVVAAVKDKVPSDDTQPKVNSSPKPNV